jgi:integrase
MRNRIKDIVTEFSPAEYYPGKDSYVAYYVLNPNIGKLQRVKIRVNSISDKERKRYAAQLVHDLNKKLYSGWNPLKKVQLNSGTKLKQAVKNWHEAKIRELRINSMRSYSSLSSNFMKWVTDHGLDITVREFESTYAVRYMSEIASTHSVRTFNSYLSCIKAMFNWMIENEYCSVNPFGKIKKKKAQEKSRQVIDENSRRQIDNWLKAKNPSLHFAANLVYYCLIRPNELTFLKRTHFDDGSVFVSPEASKNGRGDRIVIPDAAAAVIKMYLVKFGSRDNDYLFSSAKTLGPGKIKMDSRCFAKHWNKMKKALDLPESFQFYSLKDTGIVQMLSDGVPPNEVMIQARHSDLKTTTEYLKHVRNANSQHFLRTKTTAFSKKK